MQARSFDAPSAEDFEAAATTLAGVLALRDDPPHLVRYVASDPSAQWRAVRTILDLPVVDVDVSDSPQGAYLRTLVGRRFLGLPRPRYAVATLELPATLDDYLRGKRRQAVRTNVSKARAARVRCVALEDPVEQRRRVADILDNRDGDTARVADVAGERLHAGIDEFFAAVAEDGTTLVVAALTIDRTWAHVSWFVRNERDRRSAAARYLLYVDVFERLIARGVGHVFVMSAVTIPHGLRYFQRRLGFEPVNLRLAHRGLLLHLPLGRRSAERAARAA